jgi:outer membrane protein TolC
MSVPRTRRRPGIARVFALALLALAGRPSAAGADEAPLRLTIADAVERGLQHNLRALLGESGVAAARAEELRAWSALRPSFSAGLTASRQVFNLESFGFTVPEGESPLLGPFNVFDARIRLESALFDLSSRRSAQAAGERVRAAELDAAAARDLVVLACGNLYLSTVADEGRIAAAEARVATAEAVSRLARDRQEQGSASALDVLRADVELSRARELRIVAVAERDKARLALARALGLDPETAIELVQPLEFRALPDVPRARLLELAESKRGDLGAARARLAAAETELAAAKAARIPRLGLAADYGDNGQQTGHLLETWTFGAALRIPIWEGGRTGARIAAAEAEVAARRAELDDAGRAVREELVGALLDLEAASNRVAVVRESRALAARELEVARDRFGVGLASTLDVVAAQEALATADESWLETLFLHNMAKAGLAHALGVAEESFTAILDGRLEVDGTGTH